MSRSNYYPTQSITYSLNAHQFSTAPLASCQASYMLIYSVNMKRVNIHPRNEFVFFLCMSTMQVICQRRIRVLINDDWFVIHSNRSRGCIFISNLFLFLFLLFYLIILFFFCLSLLVVGFIVVLVIESGLF